MFITEDWLNVTRLDACIIIPIGTSKPSLLNNIHTVAVVQVARTRRASIWRRERGLGLTKNPQAHSRAQQVSGIYRDRTLIVRTHAFHHLLRKD
jgi:hypothetical protein